MTLEGLKSSSLDWSILPHELEDVWDQGGLKEEPDLVYARCLCYFSGNSFFWGAT